MVDLDALVPNHRQCELAELAATHPVTALRDAIIEALVAATDIDPAFKRRALFDHDLVITPARRRELIELAPSLPYTAIRQAMREAVTGAETQTPVDAAAPSIGAWAPAKAPEFRLEA